MIVMGIDPGYAILGYGVLEAGQGNRPRPLDYGVIETAAGEPFPQRLERLYRGMGQLLETFQPQAVAFLRPFFGEKPSCAVFFCSGGSWFNV